jgi:hydrogenase-4 component B
MLVLFGSAGVINMNVHSFELSDMRGSGHEQPLLSAVFLSGALGICGIPLWNGYISNVLLHESIIETGSTILEIMLLFAGGLTIAYMAKVYIVIFIDKRSIFAEPKTIYIDLYSRCALIITASILPLIGIFPNTIANNIINYSVKKLRAERLGLIYYFSGEMLTGAFISLLIGMTIYAVFIHRRNTKNFIPGQINLDDRLYRPLFRILLAVPAVFDRIQGLFIRKEKESKKQDHISAIIADNFSVGLLITCIVVCVIMTCLIINGFI